MFVHAAPFTRSAVALIFLWAAAAPALAQAPGPVPVTVAKPITREIVEDDEFIGRFEAVDEVTVRARVGGYLDKVHFRDGAIVKQGDLLFTIDQRPFQAALDEAKARLDVAQTQVDFTESQFKRAEKLTQTGNIPTATLDDRRREYLAALAAVQGAKASLIRAELDLEYTEIKAPLSGRIDRRLVSVGNLVQADQTALTTVVSLDPINFYFDVDERQFLAYARDARIRKQSLQEGAGGIDVTVRLADDAESPVKGRLDFAENRIDQATGTMRIRAQIPNKDLILQPGLFGRVNMPGSLPYKGILVPDDAIGADQDRRIVYVVDEAGKVSAKPIRIGPKIYGYRVVREGLTGDETIIINGLMRVRPGATVKPELVTLPDQAGGAVQ
ncbi:efflux RND transporter periplasmic adaptor subunit [Nordella sp. HKS 07]|uniref:efflux RND transporter periplasmic adaptor subunit n=1 Tax=Nordella sp. HKS 07 TaxID=2712222 RepID=UPI0013E1E17C|nr:efflux RND transporter periplasmic adaptor subunit [Nordella sp. HKS 07]QIG48082.1 efflux RND transporter periplasmic adaptor subunit [Nordella sp. HKS 07]